MGIGVAEPPGEREQFGRIEPLVAEAEQLVFVQQVGDLLGRDGATDVPDVEVTDLRTEMGRQRLDGEGLRTHVVHLREDAGNIT